MEYTKEITIGDVVEYERFEGTPEEIADLKSRLPAELKHSENITINMISNTDEARDNIKKAVTEALNDYYRNL